MTWYSCIYQSEATTVTRRYNIILVSSPHSAPVARSLAMYRLSWPIRRPYIADKLSTTLRNKNEYGCTHPLKFGISVFMRHFLISLLGDYHHLSVLRRCGYSSSFLWSSHFEDPYYMPYQPGSLSSSSSSCMPTCHMITRIWYGFWRFLSDTAILHFDTDFS